MNEFVAAVDLGGTLTKVGLADRTGRVRQVERLSTPVSRGSDALVEWLAGEIRRLSQSDRPGSCRGVGVVVPGIIDGASGLVRAAPNVGWIDVPLQDRLNELSGVSTAVAHDVRSAGQAEWRLGSGHGASNLLFVAIGTGVAGAMIADGRMIEASGYAGEIGHLTVPSADGLLCACGQRSCLETVASASGVVRTFGRLVGRDPSSPAGRPTAHEVANLARQGNAAAIEAFGVAAAALSEGLTTCITLLAPHVIVFGGGLSQASDLFLPGVGTRIEATITFQQMPRLRTAALGTDAGLIGAGLVGWDYVGEREAPAGEDGAL